MRWFWIDRFVEFVSGQRAVAVKNFTLAEECFHDYFPGHPTMPGSIILEGLAQTAGMLLGEQSQYRDRLVLAKVSRVKYHDCPLPGDQLVYSVELKHVRSNGAMISGECHVGSELRAEAEFFLAVLPAGQGAEQMFEPAAFMRLLRLLRVYDVGLKSDGTPLKIPAYLLQAETVERQIRGKP
jgi:3-hydroxyacyl-[acyl-carrier-protein] dehydratase